MGEVELAGILCAMLGGVPEPSVDFSNKGDEIEARLDCQTDFHVIEIGLDDRPSSRDSVHQAVFFTLGTDKTPMVVMIDRDGQEGRYEQEVRLVAEHLGIRYGTCDEDFLVRWAETQPWRDADGRLILDKVLDLPKASVATLYCDLGPEYVSGN